MSPRMGIRAWGAVMTEDGPVAEVRDLPDGPTVGQIRDMDPAWRVWRIDSRYQPTREGHSRGPACIPGRPCANCHKLAQSWWWEHGRRTKERKYRATRKRPDPGVFLAADWGLTRDTLAEAEADAHAKGWPLVAVVDGHEHHLDWIEVPR